MNDKDAAKYNYTKFKPEYYNFKTFKGPKAGEKAIEEADSTLLKNPTLIELKSSMIGN